MSSSVALLAVCLAHLSKRHSLICSWEHPIRSDSEHQLRALTADTARKGVLQLPSIVASLPDIVGMPAGKEKQRQCLEWGKYSGGGR